MILDLVWGLLPDDGAGRWLRDAGRLVGLWGPIVWLPGLAGPIGALGSVLALILLSGVAIASLATLVVATLMLFLILTEIFGLSIEVALP